MHTTFARAALALVSAGIAFDVGAQVTTDTVHRDSTAQATATPASASATNMTPGVATMPTAVRGYQRTDSVSLGGISDGVQYIYTRNKVDQINVFVSPYQSGDKLSSRDDTTNFTLNDVDQYYNTIYLAARQGTVLYDFNLLHRGPDDLHLHGHVVRGASVWATYHRRGTPRELFTYYATFALPETAVRVRVEMPSITEANETVVSFTKELIADLTPQ
jgi:hypothetical protein